MFDLQLWVNWVWWHKPEGTCTQEAERSEVKGHSLLHSELKASLDPTPSPSPTNKVKKSQLPLYCSKNTEKGKPEFNLQI